jgi:hypothetical protein
MELSVNIGALRLANPILAASGTFGYGVELPTWWTSIASAASS